MPLRYEGRARERILAIGQPGTGKTKGWVDIAKTLHSTKGEGKLYVIDSDDTVERMLDTEASEFADRIEYRVTYDWPQYTDALKHFESVMQPHDWLVADMIGPAWDAVQEYYVTQVFSQGVDDFFLEARKANKRGAALEGWKDYSVINRMYRTWSNALMQAPGHLYATSPVDAIRADSEDKATASLYGAYGVKPRGQKHVGHIFHTVLWLQQTPRDWVMTTIKDRGRDYWQGQAITNFALSYLVKTAGWKV